MSGLVIWITGLPGCGKSTLADGIKDCFADFVMLRMDEFRRIATPEPSYTETERDIVYRSIVYTAMILSQLDHNAIIDATGNMRVWRDLARQLIPNFVEIYLKCPIGVAEERELSRRNTHGAPKDIYAKGKAGWPVPGVLAPYEEPIGPELIINIDTTPAEAAIRQACAFIRNRCV